MADAFAADFAEFDDDLDEYHAPLLLVGGGGYNNKVIMPPPIQVATLYECP